MDGYKYTQCKLQKIIFEIIKTLKDKQEPNCPVQRVKYRTDKIGFLREIIL